MDITVIYILRIADAFGRGFKGLKQAIKLEFKLKLYDKVNALLKVTTIPPNAYQVAGRCTLPNFIDVRQVRCDPKLLREIHQQYLGFYREECRGSGSPEMYGAFLLAHSRVIPVHKQRKAVA